MSVASTSRRRATLLLVLATTILTVISSVPAATAQGSERKEQHERLKQKAYISVLPPIAQVGPVVARSQAAHTVLSATFTPAREDRPVVLTRRHRGEWRVVDRARTSATGLVEFTARTHLGGRRVRYRTTALDFDGLPRHNSAAVWSTAWGAPDFVDEFAGPTLSPTWRTRIPFYNPWGGRGCAKGSPDAAAVQEGALVLSNMADQSMAQPCTAYRPDGTALGAYPYRLNGHVSTEGVADFRYGVAAARMKFQQSPGQHAAFWMQPRGLLPDRPTPWGAEIDVVEWFGDGPGSGMSSNVYHVVGDAKVKVGGALRRPDRFLANRSDRWWTNYHVFSVEWTPTEYVFRIDGHETWRTIEGISHHPQFLILSLLSSDYELPRVSNPHEAQHAYVDWVQFWEA